MNGWQPIETAPKDGTAILAFNAKLLPDCKLISQVVVYWCVPGWIEYRAIDEKRELFCQIVHNWSGYWCQLGKRFSDYPPAGDDKYNGFEPTHWMPLPEPPA